ncbi:helix-hairpin-helix domain-containing protein [Geobacter sp. DSM 9736]|uniref:ComEA family DNA-binding protein n=1 Tax=Geobacter sp. DSM 9736 TaxID=1277350 RepID=UPI000B5103BF|nr:helix-hairpin-helix domain-containing protein [Geobacter sp. DSM 9736]SNB46231.1 Helix-hairpin-helix motif-containing protein [Geobacter sp. DSM 9736]
MAERVLEEKMDVNTAPREELETIEGLSWEAVDAIVRYRERHAWIRSMEELMRIPQLSADEVMILRDTVQISVSDEEEPRRLEKREWRRGYQQSGGRGMG